MERPRYLSKYLFDWEILDVVIGGKSALDSKFFISPSENKERVNHFLKSYGLDPEDPVSRAELFGNFQEAIQFIKRYFLIEGSKDGLDLKIPNSVYMISDIGELLDMATAKNMNYGREEKLWAEVILKVMHTILHADKDLRSNYFYVIQTQIFDRFYKYVYRNDDNQLILGNKDGTDIRLVDLETKSKKTRDSIIIKLLHKAENVAEELFDRVGVRFITETKFDTLRVVKFLIENNVIIPHNIKPSRSVNSIIDIEKFKYRYRKIIKEEMRRATKNENDENNFLDNINRAMEDCAIDGVGSHTFRRNSHSLDKFRTIQFTCRQLVKYKNPFLKEFKELRNMARSEKGDNPLAQKILGMDLSLIARDTRFFYPYEVQIVDIESHRNNSVGEASHQEYKRNQTISAMKRVFKNLLEYKNIDVD